MGSGQSTNSAAANITSVPAQKKGGENLTTASRSDADPNQSSDLPQKGKSKILQTPLIMNEENEADRPDGDSFPVPTGKEYDLMDKIAADLPAVIDEESRQQVEDYIQACDKGRGPVVACFATAEYLSLFLRKHKEAAELYKNSCFRPKKDKSANGVEVDGTKAYPPACFNLAQMRMTGKGGTQFSRKEGYDLFDRACRAGHGGSCHLQAKMLTSYPGAMGPGVPYNPNKAGELLEGVCEDGDPISCFTLATMLLRGDAVKAEADNVTPQEARGEVGLRKRKNEDDRTKTVDDERISLKRNPLQAEKLLLKGCMIGHAPSCYNVAVMYTQGDDGVPKDEEKARIFQKKTDELVERFGSFGFGESAG